MSERANVPCGGCSACCRHDIVPLFPEHGDLPALYEHRVISVPGKAVELLALKKGTDGFCIYLKAGRCSIWERAPHICKIFDCRRLYLSKTRPERRRLLRAGHASREVFDAGRDRLHTLDEARP